MAQDRRLVQGRVVRRASSLTVALILGGLAALALLLFLTDNATRGIAAAGEPEVASAIAESPPYTTYLPLTARWWDPGYVSPFGIWMGSWVDDAHGLQTVVDAGSRWVTAYFGWSTFEPAQDDFRWESFDANAQNAQAAGVDMFVMFTGNPSWAAQLPDGPVYDIQDLIDISRRMAERYDCDGVDDAPGSPCVHAWSFYGEPDHMDRWGDDGAGFAEMLYHVSPAIHGANPRAQVLIGGIAYDAFVEEGGKYRRTFLADTLLALNTYPGGAKSYIDAVAFHYYPISEARWPTIREKALEIKSIMAENGVGGLPLVCPEAGYWSSPKFGSSEIRQAQRLVQMYVRSLSVKMRPLSWFRVFDTAVAESPEDKYPDRTSGLLRTDGSAKPAYVAYRVLARELERCYYRRALPGPEVEGYVLELPPSRELTVLWAKVPVKTVSFPYACLRRVELLGTEASIADGSTSDADGTVNGRVSVRIDQNHPVYVEPCR